MSGDETRGRPGDEPGDEQVGSLAEEAGRLIGALGDWARDQDPGAPADGASGHPAHGPDCTWCPLCRAARAVRQTSPEVREQLLVAATSLLQAGAGLLNALQASAAERGTRPGGPGAAADEHHGVERIDLDDDTEQEV